MLPYYPLGDFKTPEAAHGRAKGGNMQSEVQFAGFGGQGVMLMGQILAHAAMEEGYEVVLDSLLRSRDARRDRLLHGRDQRPADRLADHPQSQHLVAMNRPSLEKFAPP